MARTESLRSTVAALAPVLLVLAGGGPARGQEEIPCDHITGSGKISVSTSKKASFGLAGGVKDRAFWGNLTYKDNDLGLQVDSMSVTSYSGPDVSTRVVGGTAKTNLYGTRRYTVTAADDESGGADTFRIELDNGYTRQGALSSGEVKLRKGNRRSTPPPGFTCSQPGEPTPPDTTPPTSTITSPSSGSTVSGTTAVSADASDNVGVAGVQFKLDGADLGAEDTSAPYSVAWDTSTAPNGSHTLTAVARDTAGNTGTSPPSR